MSQLFGLAIHVGHVVRSKILGRPSTVLAARERTEKVVDFIMTSFGYSHLSLVLCRVLVGSTKDDSYNCTD